MIKKPDTIYTTEETTTTKNFNYGKPEGWDKKPPLINPKKFKMNWWQILKGGLSRDQTMEPKYIMKYENWMHELRLVAMSVFIVFCLSYIMFHSSLITSSAMSDGENEKETLLDRGLDYVMGKYDEWKGVPPIIAKPDTIYQVKKDTIVPLLTQEQLDSIINSYNQRLDSLKATDSTAKIE